MAKMSTRRRIKHQLELCEGHLIRGLSCLQGADEIAAGLHPRVNQAIPVYATGLGELIAAVSRLSKQI